MPEADTAVVRPDTTGGADPGGAATPLGASIRVEHVWKTFRLPHDRPYTLKQRVLHPRQSRAATQLHALRDVSFEVRSGEFFGIIGRNGSGKSTLLKCLAGIYKPDRGTIAVAGRVSPFIELGVGFNPELTARDNVVVNCALLGISRAEALARFDEVIHFAELEQFVDLKLKNYSSGMHVRLGFATAIQAEAEIYLVDEVLAVGDARFQEKCFDVFRDLKRRGRTVIYVTHDVASVERFCDRVMLLERGEVASIGEPRTVVHIYRQHDLEIEQGESHVESAENSKRWGDGAAEVLEAWFEDAEHDRREIVTHGSSITFRVRVRFARPMDDPIFGATVKTERGEAVFVNNTDLHALATGSFAAGDEAIFSMRFEALFADGRYTLSPAVAYRDAQRIADWREDYVALTIRGERYSGGLVDLPNETWIERPA